MTQLAQTREPKPIQVLLVDDEASQMELTKLNLETLDPTIALQTAPTPFEALRLLKDQSFDCIVTDYLMPAMNGIQFAGEVRKHSDVPIIIYTGRGSEEVASAAFAAGVDDYVRKEEPLSHYEILARRIRQASEKKKAEGALNESEEKYRRIVETSHDGIMVSDLSGRITFANRRMGDMLGYSVDELVGKPGIELASTSDRAMALGMAERRLSGVSESYEIWMIRKDGGDVCMLASGSPVNDSRGRHIGNQGVYTDITDRKKAEEALRESGERYHHLIEYAPTGIYEVDFRTKRFTSINEAMCRILGYSEAELMQMGPLEILEEGSRVLFLDRLRRAQVGEALPDSVEYRVRRKDGSIIWGLLHIRFNYSAGQIVGAFVVAHDVTERKNAAAELGKNNQKLNEIMGSISDTILAIDRDWKIAYVNSSPSVEAGAKSVGLKNAQGMVGKKYLELFPAYIGTHVNDAISAAMEKREVRKFQYLSKYSGKWTESTVYPSETGVTIYARDITDRKQTEEALRESEQRYRDLSENSPDGVLVHLMGEVLYANPTTLRLYGAESYDEFSKVNIAKHLRPDRVDAYFERAKTMLDGGSVPPREMSIIRLDGRQVQVEVVSSAIQYGQRRAIQSIIRDVSERKKAEDALRESEERFRVLSQTSPVGVGVSSAEGVLLYTNPAYESILGYGGGELLGKKASDLYMYPEERTSWLGKMKRGDPVKDFELRLRRKDGDHIWVAINTSDIQFGGKQAVMGTIQDISARKRAEEELRSSNEHLSKSEEELAALNEELRSAQEELQRYAAGLESIVGERTRQLRITEERLRSFLDSATDGFFLLDRDLKLLDINENARLSYLGANRREDLIGRDLMEITPGMKETDRYPLFKHVLETGMPKTISYRAPPIWGNAWVSLSAFKVGDGLGVITRNVTKQVELEEKLRETERGEAVERVSAMVAHDIRSPINTASQALQMAKGDPAKSEQLMGMAEKSLGRAIEMIEALRENTRLIESKPRDVNMRLIVEDTIREMPAKENVLLESSFGEGVEVVRVDPELTRRVLENLIQNAAEAMPNGGRVRVRAWGEGRDVILTVADSGVGIPKDVGEKVFTPLFTTKAKGMGLGLSFCKRAVEAQGGSISFESKVGAGTTFRITLPLAEAVFTQ